MATLEEWQLAAPSRQRPRCQGIYRPGLRPFWSASAKQQIIDATLAIARRVEAVNPRGLLRAARASAVMS